MGKAKLVSLPKILDKRGNLSVIESENHVPFSIKRSYLIYDVPGGEVRGGHAFVEQKEMIIALSGSLDIIVFDGKKESKFSLNRSYQGLYIPNGLWRHMENFATNTLVLVICNTVYNENDYIRNKKVYINENISI
ncbi:FdtA/QdtA family cupin domain-containing protein [Polaribacter sp.]|nr:FdtA/QdtA family cupin domain-containing protein [Polaribacter sp.]